MQYAVRQTVKIQPGGLVEVRAPELREGATADVIVLVDTETQPVPRSLSSFIGAARGGFDTPQEADTFVRRERDAWTS